MNALLGSMLESGAYTIVADFSRQEQLTAQVRELILDAVGAITGAAARADLARRGIELLHLHLPAEEIRSLRDRVMPAVRADLFRFTCELGERLLGLEGEFFVDDYTILRVNYPYEVGLSAAHSAENPGIGRVDPQVKAMASSTQRRDEQYDPKGYHKHTPPASWAHGPHKDTWTGHSRQGINLWWALSDVVEQNSMIFYPATFGKGYRADPRSLYLAAGYPLPRPRKMALHAGEILIFNPEMLHATHLNTAGLTRIALSARINPVQPRFDPACFYAREFWHSSLDIKQGRMDVIRQFKRDENLEDPAGVRAEIAQPQLEYVPIAATPGPDGWETVRLGALDPARDRQLIALSGGRQVALFRQPEGWAAVQPTCPHLDTSLLDGFCGAGQVFCPAHGVAFDLASGSSASPLLTLETYAVELDADTLRIRARDL